jgi:hypothetical protein
MAAEEIGDRLGHFPASSSKSFRRTGFFSRAAVAVVAAAAVPFSPSISSSQ